jgi:formyltetrahydrofolate deformylase
VFTYVVTLQCQDAPGIVRATSSAIFTMGGNILENDQFTDPVTGEFCMRTRFETAGGDVDEVRTRLNVELAPFTPRLGVRLEHQRRRVLVMVSKVDHCLADLLYRLEQGDLPVEIPVVVGNHPDLAPLCARYGVPFYEVPLTDGTKTVAEARLRELIELHSIDFVVLARYMQILSPEICSEFSGRIINIHHSFLPGFKGARPYHQAYERGVKLIGATAHFVTSNLDEGPIIEQDVLRVTHARQPEDLVSLGRDIERNVLARAVRLVGEDRVALVGQRTVIFSQ